VQFKGGSDITKGGDISVIDFPAGFRRACGPPARVQGSLVYRDGEPIGETDRRYYLLFLFINGANTSIIRGILFLLGNTGMPKLTLVLAIN
jgi:hypothetical protein